MKFTELNLQSYILKGLEAQGFDTATEIQALTLPLIRKRSDIIGLSHTGSGKTYAFGIPALECIDSTLSGVQVLIVCPTRELAMQETEDLRKLTSFTDSVKIVAVFGGSNMERQTHALKTANIVVGTPGRLMDHLRRKTLKLANLKMIILDEADEMLNMGFKEDIETILKATPDTRQTIMFSATMPAEIMKLTKQYMKLPETIKSKTQDSPQTFIKQFFLSSEKDKKFIVLNDIYEKFKPTISIIFCNTKRMTEKLASMLTGNNLPAECLNGDMRQNERRRVMENFKKHGGILVATDVAARGIDVKNVDIIVNYDFPENEDYYVHRIGRTGRAGKKGIAFNIISTQQQLNDLQALIGKTGNTIEEYKTNNTAQFVKAIPEKSGSSRGAKYKSNRVDYNKVNSKPGNKFGNKASGRKTYSRFDDSKPDSRSDRKLGNKSNNLPLSKYDNNKSKSRKPYEKANENFEHYGENKSRRGKNRNSEIKPFNKEKRELTGSKPETKKVSNNFSSTINKKAKTSSRPHYNKQKDKTR